MPVVAWVPRWAILTNHGACQRLHMRQNHAELYLSVLIACLLRSILACLELGMQFMPRDDSSADRLVVKACATVEVQLEEPGTTVPALQPSHIYHKLKLCVKGWPAISQHCTKYPILLDGVMGFTVCVKH